MVYRKQSGMKSHRGPKKHRTCAFLLPASFYIDALLIRRILSEELLDAAWRVICTGEEFSILVLSRRLPPGRYRGPP